MTFENIEDIIKLLKLNSKPPEWVVKARADHKELKALVYGDEFTDLLLTIEHIETAKKSEARKKYSRPIVDMNERILRLLDNVYTATGGTKDYKIESEQKRKDLLKAITHNRGNKSLEKWLQTMWSKDVFIVDPAGVILLEYKADTDKPPYPTYKSIDKIRNYEANGQNLEWIIFEPKEIDGDEYVRFIDDVNDYTFKKDGDEYTLREELSFVHPFGKVPGLVSSNYERVGTQHRFSFIHKIVPLEKEAARDLSILTIFKFQNGFATPVRPAMLCPSCHGLGKKGVDDCPDCGGTGEVLRRDVTDEIKIPVPLTPGRGIELPNGLFQYFTPPIEIWDRYEKEIQKHENQASDTLWGTHKERFENERTAFETFVDTQPVTTKLSEVSEVAEFMEWQLTEWIANYLDPTKKKDEPISVISYGKMFIIEPAEAIMEKYRTNKKDGVSVVVLDRQLLEYLTSKYKNNPTALRMELTKKVLDYYVHYTVQEVNDIFGPTEAQKKMLFTDWWETITLKDLQAKTEEQLTASRDQYILEQLIELGILNPEGGGEDEETRRKAQANLKGTVGGIEGVLKIQEALNTNAVSPEAAIVILQEFYGFTEQQARDLITKTNTNE
jgi:hypothetical protein